jgi:carbon starvation protein
LAFALLAFSTFVYDTLDVCSRLARYILQELLGLNTRGGAFLATAITLFVPFAVLMLTREKGYVVAWPIFGTSNQLLASLTLLAVSVWLLRTGRSAIYAIVPMVFMLTMTLWSLILLCLPLLKSLPGLFEGVVSIKPDTVISGIFGIVLLVLSIWLVFEAVNLLVLKPTLRVIDKR